MFKLNPGSIFFSNWGFPADFVEQHLASIVAKVALLRAQVEPALDAENRVDFDHGPAW